MHILNDSSFLDMREDFLHYVWQYQAFQREALTTHAGESLQIIHWGAYNRDAGPDFSEAEVRIGEVAWHGPVEIHLKSSDWYAHKHQEDSAYDRVILHVVWEHDRPVTRANGTEIPTLVLGPRVNLKLQQTYRSLTETLAEIPCADQLMQVREITRLSMLDRALMDRLEKKAEWMDTVYQQTRGDWDEVAYQALARNFGFRVNQDAMWEVSRSIPLKLVLKYRHRPEQLEALLLGAAGFLEEIRVIDPYYQILKNEWDYLSKLHQLEAPNPPLPWKQGRIRPGNLPTRRLGQLAALLVKEGRIFAMLREITSLKELLARLSVMPSMYWQTHYNFTKPAKSKLQGLGKASLENVVINTVVPLLVLYGKKQDDQRFVEKGVEMLQHMAAEDNTIIRRWAAVGMEAKTAFDSQALLGQYHGFCTPRKCLSCPVGVSLLRHG